MQEDERLRKEREDRERKIKEAFDDVNFSIVYDYFQNDRTLPETVSKRFRPEEFINRNAVYKSIISVFRYHLYGTGIEVTELEYLIANPDKRIAKFSYAINRLAGKISEILFFLVREHRNDAVSALTELKVYKFAIGQYFVRGLRYSGYLPRDNKCGSIDPNYTKYFGDKVTLSYPRNEVVSLGIAFIPTNIFFYLIDEMFREEALESISNEEWLFLYYLVCSYLPLNIISNLDFGTDILKIDQWRNEYHFLWELAQFILKTNALGILDRIPTDVWLKFIKTLHSPALMFSRDVSLLISQLSTKGNPYIFDINVSPILIVLVATFYLAYDEWLIIQYSAIRYYGTSDNIKLDIRALLNIKLEAKCIVDLSTIRDPNTFRKHVTDELHMTVLDIAQNGKSKHNFSEVLNCVSEKLVIGNKPADWEIIHYENLWNPLNTVDSRFQAQSPSNRGIKGTPRPVIRINSLMGMVDSITSKSLGRQFSKGGFSTNNRTLIYRSTDYDRILCIKFRKDMENQYNFLRESSMMKNLSRDARIKSRLPEPILLCQVDYSTEIKDPRNTWYKFLTEVLRYSTASVSYTDVIVYLAPSNYFEYADTLESLPGLEVYMHDVGHLLATYGIFHEMTGLAHNVESHRSYVPLIQAFRCDETQVAGRLEAITKAIEYPNAGASGLRDVGDIQFLANYVNRTSSMDLPKDIGELLKYYSPSHITELLLMNSIAIYSLSAMMLIINAYWKYYQNPTQNQPNPMVFNWREPILRESVKRWFISVNIEFMMGFTRQDEVYCRQWVVDHFGDDNMNRLVSQCLFWWNPNQPDGYLNYLKSETLPPEVIEPSTEVKFGISDGPVNGKWGNYQSDYGFSYARIIAKYSSEGKARFNPNEKDSPYDWGVFNGPILVHELEKFCYTFSSICLAHRLE